MSYKEPVWTFEEARGFCYQLHKHLELFGYGVGITGGTLWRGTSDKDIDVIIYPYKRISGDFDTMYKSLPDFGLKFTGLPNNNIGYTDDGKRVEIWDFQGKRIDLFFLS
jgi:hypothetical protein